MLVQIHLRYTTFSKNEYHNFCDLRYQKMQSYLCTAASIKITNYHYYNVCRHCRCETPLNIKLLLNRIKECERKMFITIIFRYV